MTDLAARPHGRLVRVRDALTPREWARAGAMAGTIVGLNVPERLFCVQGDLRAGRVRDPGAGAGASVSAGR